MTLPAAITPAGVDIPTVEELIADLAADQRANVDPLIATDADSLVGNFNAIFASHLREAYEAIQVAYDTVDPNNAEDTRLDNVSAITGSIREGATYSLFTGSSALTVNLNAGVTLPAGSRASVLGFPSILFETTEDVTNSGGSPADVTVPARATVTGPVRANSGTLTVIATPVVGWNSVNNTRDALIGSDGETDAQFRVRRELELQQAGTSTRPSLLSNLIAMVSSDDGVTRPIISAFVIENESDVMVNGVPPHGFEAVIWDGPSPAAANADVAAVIFAARGLGIPTSGDVSVVVRDSNDVPVTIRFSRATQRTTTIEVTLKYIAGAYVGDDAVKTALVDAFQGVNGAGQPVAGVVSFSRYMAVVQQLGGVSRIENWRMHLNGASYAAFTDLTPGAREVAVLDSSGITVLSSEV